jgi:hypothetical protein
MALSDLRTLAKPAIIQMRHPPITIALAKHETRNAAYGGMERQLDNIFEDRPAMHGVDPDKRWDSHIEGCGGEVAVAKHTGTYWSANIGNLQARDVGDYQVRCAPPHLPFLRLHKTDHDDDPFVLAIGRMPHYRLFGWLYAGEGKKDHWWSDPQRSKRWAYFVPVQFLRPMDTLKT